MGKGSFLKPIIISLLICCGNCWLWASKEESTVLSNLTTEEEPSWFENRMGNVWKVFQIHKSDRDPRPSNVDEYPNGFWIGKQQIFCVIGIDMVRRLQESNPEPTIRSKRSIQYPRVNIFESVHRIIYYKGLMFEWGTGQESSFTYHVGPDVANTHCTALWEDMPAGESNCSEEAVIYFTENYSKIFAEYNLVTNNCHHYINRLAQLLLMPSCTVTPESEHKIFKQQGTEQMFQEYTDIKEFEAKQNNDNSIFKNSNSDNSIIVESKEEEETQPTEKVKVCEDRRSDCREFSSYCEGYDELWTEWMIQYCALTCGCIEVTD